MRSTSADAYTTEDLVFDWRKDAKPVERNDDIRLPEYELIDVSHMVCNQNINSTGKRSLSLSSLAESRTISLLRVDLIKWVLNVRPPVRTSVRLSTKCSFDFKEIWYAGRGRRVMHEGMQYDPIQGQGQGHEP